jgi:hypothetical protein
METSIVYHQIIQASPGSPARAAPIGTPQEQVRLLLARYPNLGETELARLINLYRGFSALDSALLLSDEALAPRLDRFTQDHRSKVRPPFRQYAGLLFYAVLTIGALAWAISIA